MKRRLVIDKTLYVLVALMWVSSLVLSGCSVSDEDFEEELEEELVEEAPELEDEDDEVVVSEEAAPDTSDPMAPESEPVEEIVPAEEVSSENFVSEEDTTTAYVDGSYFKTGNYTNPEGQASINVQMQIENDKVTALAVSGNASDDTSQTYQNLFIAEIGSLVVGQPLDSLGDFGPLNGSSLTPNGFNAALDAIKAEAKS